ncbi:MAG: type restriction/modification system, specificity subunit, partial [Pseudomonadota bacterium]
MSIIVAAGYKQTKVGIIPEDWDVVKLGDIGKFIGGGTPSTQNIGFWSGDIPWISSSDLIEDNIRHINITRFITKEAINNSATKMVPINSILIVTRVGVGKVAVNQQVLCTSQDFQNIILENNNSYFFAYLLQQKTRKLIELNQGTTIKGLVKEDLSSLLMESPPLAEQEKIAEILTTWDNAIIKHEQLIEQKQIFKKGLMQQIFSQQLRFKDDNDNYYPDWQ